MEPANNPTKRAPVTLKIKFKSGTIDEFVQRYAGDISHGGIFIRTKTPLTVGTTLRFEFQLRDAYQLMGGDGTVVWIRENDPNRPTMVSGMGVRFDRLNDGSQLVLDRVLAHKGRPSQVIASPAVSFEDSTKENISQGFAPGRYAPTISDNLDDDKTIQRAAAPGIFGGDADEFSDVPNQSTKIRPLAEIAQQLAAHEGAAGIADISEQRTMPGVGLIGESTRPLSISDLADAVPVDDPTIAMAAPVFPEHAATADSGVYALPGRAKPANAAATPALAANAAAQPKSRVGMYAGIGVLLLAAAAATATYVFTIKQGAAPADTVTTTPAEPAPVAPTPTPQPGPAPVAVAVDPAPLVPTPAPPSTPVAPTMLETTIVASTEGATITLVKPPAVVGERITGTSPFAVLLPPDSELNAIVSAPGFRDATVNVRAGETVTATLVALPTRAKPKAVKRPPIKPTAAVKPPKPVTEPAVTPTTPTTEPTKPPTDPSVTSAPATPAPTPPAGTPTTPPTAIPPATATTPAAPTPVPAEKPATPSPPPAPTTREPEPAWVKP